MSIRSFASAIAAMFVLAAPACQLRPRAHLGPLVAQHHEIAADGAQAAEIALSFYGGKVDLKAGGDALVQIDSRDNIKELATRVEAEREGRHIDVRGWLHSDARLNFFDDAESVNEWAVRLGGTVPVALDLELAMHDGSVDLGGVPLRRASVSLGMCSSTLEFTRPNPIEMERLAIEAGAGDFKFRGIGHARASTIDFDLSCGEFVVDLSGDWERVALLRVEGGACSIEIRVPRGLTVRIDGRETTFAEVDVDGVPEDGERCWADALAGGESAQLVVELDVQFGSVTVLRD